MSALRLISQIQEEGGDPGKVFSDSYLRLLPKNISGIVNADIALMEFYGYMEALDYYFHDIANIMELEDFPKEEIEILRQLGSDSPHGELIASVMTTKSRSLAERRILETVSLKAKMEDVANEVAKLSNNIENNILSRDLTKKPKKIFAGLGKILTGSVISIGNIGIALGVLPLPVDGQSASVGSLVSVTAGVGVVLEGVGALRGE